MGNVLRTLLYNREVSLTVADTTELVSEGIRLHKLSPASAYIYGKAMSALTYTSACLKEESGEVSFTLQCDGAVGDIGGSGNRALFLRGYLGGEVEGEPGTESERLALGENGSFTVVRDDGYNRPFVGTCAFPGHAGFDEILEEYYKVSEQLPTRIQTLVEIDEGGRCAFAGVIALQPLPFASEETLQKVAAVDLSAALAAMKGQGVEAFAKSYFTPDEEVWEVRRACYRCNCSREYLSGVLVTLGEAQLRDIIRTEGAVRVHCHYCNTDYEFTSEDADELFPKI